MQRFSKRFYRRFILCRVKAVDGFQIFFEHDQPSIVQQTSFDLVAMCEREIGESDTNNFKRY